MKFACGRKKAADLYAIYKTLFKAFGPQKWWPAKTRFEVIAGAVLTQNTAWANVERAINNLKNAGLLSIKLLHETSERKLHNLLKPSGYFRVKSNRLKNTVNFLINNYNGNLHRFFKEPLKEARRKLLEVKGIGPETADSILLYAGKKPIFVVDAYTRRIFERMGISGRSAGYEDIQNLFMKNIPHSIRLYNEYHALIVRLGKDICRKKPACGICPFGHPEK